MTSRDVMREYYKSEVISGEIARMKRRSEREIEMESIELPWACFRERTCHRDPEGLPDREVSCW